MTRARYAAGRADRTRCAARPGPASHGKHRHVAKHRAKTCNYGDVIAALWFIAFGAFMGAVVLLAAVYQ